MMKKLLGGAMAVMMAASLAACGQSGTQTTAAGADTAAAGADSTADQSAGAQTDAGTVTPGKLTVGTSPDFAPYEFYHMSADGKYELTGFDIALAQKIADDMGLELEVVPLDFDGILMELQNDNVDLGISGFSPSLERAQSFDFSDIYYTGGQCLVVRKEDLEKYKDFASLKGQPVGAQTGSIQYELAQENTPEANIIGLTKVTDIVSQLTTGKLEAAYMETAVAEQYQKNYPEMAIAFDVEYKDAEGSAVAVKKGNTALLQEVNKVIKAALEDGSMNTYISEAQDLASDEGKVFEGHLDAQGNAETEAAPEEGAESQAQTETAAK